MRPIVTPRVLLVYHPSVLRNDELVRVDGSLGLLYLAGALLSEGIEVDILDASVGPVGCSLNDTFNRRIEVGENLVRVGMSAEMISQTVAKGDYNFVGVHSNFTPQTDMALEVVRAVKNVSPEIPVVVGGVNARSLPERFLRGGADIIAATEGETTIVKLARAFEAGWKLAASGTITLQDDEIFRDPIAYEDVRTNLDKLPLPAWHLLPWGHYDAVPAAGRCFHNDPVRSATIMTSRGCPFRCAYCHISIEKENASESGGIGSLRFKSVARVLDELRRLRQLHVKKVYFEDDSLLANKSRVKEIFRAVEDMGLEIADVNGVNLVHFLKGGPSGPVIDEDYLRLLRDAGFSQIVFPVESASQRVLKKYATDKLDHDVLDVVELVRVATKLGISCPINMMLGFPDETEEEMRTSIELGRKLVEAGAPYCSFKVVVPFPGSTLYEMALRDGHLERDFDPNIFNWRSAVMKETVVGASRIEEIAQEATHSVNSDDFDSARKALEADTGGRWKGEIV